MTDDIQHHIGDEMHVGAYMDLKPQPMRYLCPYGCNKLIASRTIDYHKNNGCGRRHSDNTTGHPELKKRFYCCGACLAEFVSRAEFHTHLRVEHDVHPEIHTMQFADRQTFDRFKHWLESEGGAHYRHKSGSKRRGRGRGIFLACNRSGNVSSDKSQVTDRTGPFRLGFTCTAYIHATEHNDGHVTAEVCGDHYGHDARMRLPNVIKYIIAQKQMEQCTPMEIIAFLRHHFLESAAENIYAQRICFVDTDELKSILVSCTKKWSREGIPKTMEIWEEELLEKVGIEWPPSSMRSPHEFIETRKLTTADIARQENWPRPRVFLVKNRREDGVLVPFDLPGAQSSNEYGQEEMVDDPRYIEMEMGEYEDEGYIQEAQMVVEEEEEVEEVVVPQNYQRHQEIMNKDNEILEEGEVGVEVEREVVVTTVDSTDQMINEEKSCVEDHVVLESPNNEIVIVDGDVDEEMEDHLHHHHHSHHQHHQHQHQHAHSHQHHDPDQPGTSNTVERYIEATKANQLEQLMEEIEAFKITVLKRAEHTSPANLKSLLIRFQTLHHSIMEKEQAQSMTVFPNQAKFLYRPGKGLEKTEQEYLQRGTGDVTLQPIEDEISDDEDLMVANRGVMQYNAGIWN